MYLKASLLDDKIRPAHHPFPLADGHSSLRFHLGRPIKSSVCVLECGDGFGCDLQSCGFATFSDQQLV